MDKIIPLQRTMVISASHIAVLTCRLCCFSNSKAGKTFLSETFEQKAQMLREKSPLGHLAGWQLDGLIAKSNDDLRQEVGPPYPSLYL